MKIFHYIAISILIYFILINSSFAVYNESNIGSYEQELSKFPNSYKAKIEELHRIYPNAIFVAQDVFYDWNQKK